MTIYPIEGFVIFCDECGEKKMFYENSDEIYPIDIDKQFSNYCMRLERNGWVIDNGRILCPKCAGEKNE